MPDAVCQAPSELLLIVSVWTFLGCKDNSDTMESVRQNTLESIYASFKVK